MNSQCYPILAHSSCEKAFLHLEFLLLHSLYMCLVSSHGLSPSRILSHESLFFSLHEIFVNLVNDPIFEFVCLSIVALNTIAMVFNDTNLSDANRELLSQARYYSQVTLIRQHPKPYIEKLFSQARYYSQVALIRRNSFCRRPDAICRQL
jgi:hypothetical protein